MPLKIPSFKKSDADQRLARLKKAEDELRKSSIQRENAGQKMDSLAELVDDPEHPSARHEYEAAQEEYRYAANEHDRLSRVLSGIKRENAQTALKAAIQARRQEWQDLDDSFNPLFKSSDRIDELFSELGAEFAKLHADSIATIQAYQALKNDPSLKLEPMDPLSTGISKARINTGFLLQLTKYSLPGGASWFDSVQKIPSLSEGIREAKAFALKARPKE